LHGRELCNLQFIKGLLRRFMNCDFLTVFFKEFFAISRQKEQEKEKEKEEKKNFR
jgi:hypothetical protein